MDYKYFCLSRPPGPGCQPSGYTAIEPQFPQVFPSDFPRGHFGTVEYPTRLSRYNISSYCLMPVNPVERAVYNAWLDCDRDAGEALECLRHYFALPINKLEAGIDHDFAAAEVYDLRQTGVAWEQVEVLLGGDNDE